MKFELTSEQQRKILDNRRLVHNILKKYNIPTCDYDDYEQIGIIGLIKATCTYQEEKNVKFYTYASKCIRNEIKMELHRAKKLSREISLSNAINTNINGFKLSLEDILYDKSAPDLTELIEKKQMIEDSLNIVLNEFTRRDAIVYFLTVGEMKQSEIGKLLSVSQSYISRLQKKIFSNLKHYMQIGKRSKGGIFLVSIENSHFKIILNKGKDIIWLPVEEKSFKFIGKLLYEIENPDFQYINNI